MINEEGLKTELIRLAKFHIDLKEKGGPGEDGELFEELLALQDDILTGFGLPLNPDNEKILEFEKVPTEIEIDEIIIQLKNFATNYLLSDAKTELQILNDAQEMKLDAFYLLPELKVTTHSYTIFIYEKIFLEKKDCAENILLELRLVKNIPKVLNALGMLDNTEDINSVESKDLIKFISDSGVKYLHEFINSK